MTDSKYWKWITVDRIRQYIVYSEDIDTIKKISKWKKCLLKSTYYKQPADSKNYRLFAIDVIVPYRKMKHACKVLGIEFNGKSPGRVKHGKRQTRYLKKGPKMTKSFAQIRALSGLNS